MNVLPLKDDRAECYSASRLKWAKRFYGASALLEKTLKRQLSLRPDMDYGAFWSDEEERRIAALCARQFRDCFGLPNERLVPDDALELLLEVDGESFGDVLNCLEQEFRLILYDSDVLLGAYEDDWKMKAFAHLVRYIREHKGSLSRAEVYKRHKLGCGCACGLWLVFLSINGCTASVISDSYHAVQCGEFGSKNFFCLTFGLLFSGLSLCIAYAGIRNWLAERRAIREEQK